MVVPAGSEKSNAHAWLSLGLCEPEVLFPCPHVYVTPPAHGYL
jgi:hypothetical protein